MEIKCKYCKKVFSQRKNLYAHIRNIHNKTPNTKKNKNSNKVICPFCKLIVVSHLELRKHVSEKHDIEIKEEEKEFCKMSGMFLICTFKEYFSYS